MSPIELGPLQKPGNEAPRRSYIDTDSSPPEQGELFAFPGSPRLFLNFWPAGQESRAALYEDLESPESAGTSVKDAELALAAIPRIRDEGLRLGAEPLIRPHKEA